MFASTYKTVNLLANSSTADGRFLVLEHRPECGAESPRLNSGDSLFGQTPRVLYGQASSRAPPRIRSPVEKPPRRRRFRRSVHENTTIWAQFVVSNKRLGAFPGMESSIHHRPGTGPGAGQGYFSGAISAGGLRCGWRGQTG